MASGTAGGARMILAAAALAASTGNVIAAVPASDRLDFAVMRNGSQIGQHELVFHETGGDTKVDINTKVAVKIVFITAYHFEHEGHEVWHDGRLISLKSHTDDDGTKHVLNAAATADGVEIRADGQPPVTAAPLIPASLWNEGILKGDPILNTLDGSLMKISVSDLGTETVTARGKQILAHHYAIRGDLERDLWYDRQNVLVRVRFKGEDDSDIEYVLEQ